jgi:hypothetical protein
MIYKKWLDNARAAQHYELLVNFFSLEAGLLDEYKEELEWEEFFYTEYDE